MKEFNPQELTKLFIPSKNSTKGDSGKLLIIAGSTLFHAASLWPLEVASRIVDMVFYASTSSNNEIVQKNKESFLNGIVVERKNMENYLKEADCILIGPGLPRDNGIEPQDENTKDLTEKLFLKFPDKKWVVDGGSLQAISPEDLPKRAIITPNIKEFEMLKAKIKTPEIKNKLQSLSLEEQVVEFADKFKITILLKGEKDLIANETESVIIKGGNQGMTKGGTGDVLAGLVASLYCRNEAFLSAKCASFINKKSSDNLYKTMGLYYNATDLVNEIPKTMNELIF